MHLNKIINYLFKMIHVFYFILIIIIFMLKIL